MDFIKKNKKILIICVVVILFIFMCFKLFFVDGTKDAYGSRLKGISKMKISNTQVKDIKNEITSSNETDKVDYVLKGRLVNILITLKKGTSIDVGKELANKSIKVLDDEQNKYYDVQVFLLSDESDDNYPLIGYKNKNRNDFVWE